MPNRVIHTVRRNSPHTATELHRAAPGPLLRNHIHSYVGFHEHAPDGLHRRYPASDTIPVIFSFGPKLRFTQADWESSHSSFTAGPSDTFAQAEFTGEQHGVQVDLYPFAARMLFGMPMAELRNQVVDLESTLGNANLLTERLYDAPTWEDRFELLDSFFLGVFAQTSPPPEPLQMAWHALRTTHGFIPIASVATEIGWSRKHLARQFQDHIGLSPKTVARIVRFQNLLDKLRDTSEVQWAQLAVDCGYFDQAHLIRDFTEFTGETPGLYVGGQLENP